MAGNEAIVIPIIIDPKAGVAGLKAVGDQAMKTNQQMGGLSSGTDKVGGSFKGAAKNVLAMLGAMNLAQAGARILVESFIAMVSGANRLVTAQELIRKSQIEAVNSTRDEVVQLQALLTVAKNAELSYSQRQGALDKLVKQYPDYLRGLTLEKLGTEEAAKAVDKLTGSLTRKAQVDLLIKQVAELENGAASLKRIGKNVWGGSVLGAATRTSDDLFDLAKELKADLADLMAEDSKTNFGALFGKTIGEKGVEVKELKLKPNKVKIERIPSMDEFAKIPLNVDFPPEEVKQEAIDFASMFGREISAYFKNNEITDFTLINAEAAFEEAKKAGQQLLDIQMAQATLFSEFLTPAALDFIDAMLQKEDALHAFFNGLAQSAKQLLKQLLSVAIQAAAISIFTGGSFGSAFKGVAKKVFGFAGGGLVTGPVSALVGEGHGTSRSNPEVISPLDRLKDFFSNMMNDNMGFRAGSSMGMSGAVLNMPREVILRGRGRDLVGVMVLEQESQGRTG